MIETNTTDTDTESLKGLDYLMHQLEKDIKFSKGLYEIDKKAWLKHGKIPLYEGSMHHHKENVTELTSAYEETERLRNIARYGENGCLLGEITAYAYMVRNGKPAALVSVQTRYIDAAIETIESHKLYHHHAHLAEGWVEMWMYKTPTMKEIIECLPSVPTTAFDHWVLGKLFGYSDTEIYTFIMKQKLKRGTDHD